MHHLGPHGAAHRQSEQAGTVGAGSRVARGQGAPGSQGRVGLACLNTCTAARELEPSTQRDAPVPLEKDVVG